MSNMAALVAGRPYTRADLVQTPDDGRRYELIDGVLVVSAAPGRVWELAADGLYREAAKVLGDEEFPAVQPFPVTVVPAELVR
jgi:hypothetical protein